jgi:hypothetical protein
MGANRRASQHIRHGLDGEGMQSEITVLSSVEDPPNHFPQRTRKIPSNLSGSRVGRGTFNNEHAFHRSNCAFLPN